MSEDSSAVESGRHRVQVLSSSVLSFLLFVFCVYVATLIFLRNFRKEKFLQESSLDGAKLNPLSISNFQCQILLDAIIEAKHSVSRTTGTADNNRQTFSRPSGSSSQTLPCIELFLLLGSFEWLENTHLCRAYVPRLTMVHSPSTNQSAEINALPWHGKGSTANST